MPHELKPVGAFQRRKPVWDPGSVIPAEHGNFQHKKSDEVREYRYSQLFWRKSFRILRILAGPPDSPIFCVPSETKWGGLNRQNYNALSYWWGEDEATHPIYIYKYDNEGSHHGYKDDLSGKRSSNSFGVFYVRGNLAAALREFRSEKDDVNFWIDAICIDQSDTDEKTTQVAMMDLIYSQAQSVSVWLGSGKPETKETFEFLYSILDLRVLDRLIRTQETPMKWVLVLNLLKNRWFSRRWIIQELVLAKTATVHWGKEVMLWSDFAEAIALFMTKIHEIQEILRNTDLPSPLSSNEPRIAEIEPRVVGANALVEATSSLFRKSVDGEVLERLLYIEVLVTSLFVAFESSEPRDAIYAVLSLAKDTEIRPQIRRARSWERPRQRNTFVEVALSVSPFLWWITLVVCRECLPFWRAFKGMFMAEDLKDEQESRGRSREVKDDFSILDHRLAPDYDKSLVDICAGFMEFCVEESNSLDILCRHWAPELPSSLSKTSQIITEDRGNYEDEESMPSWIPSIKGHAYAGPFGVFRPRTNADSLVGSPDRQHRRVYNSCTGLRPYALFKVNAPAQKKETDEAWKKHALRRNCVPNRVSAVGRRYSGQLVVKGFILHEIKHISDRVLDGVIPREAFSFAGWETHHDNVPDVLWRTLVADRGPHGVAPPPWYRRACLECLTQCNSSGDLNTKDVANHADTPETMRLFLARVQSVVWGRRFVLTEVPMFRGQPRRRSSWEPPMFGLVPGLARERDVICIVYGCSVPVVLREVEGKGGEQVWEFVGECFVHGMMDGEAMPLIRTLRYPYTDSETFVLV